MYTKRKPESICDFTIFRFCDFTILRFYDFTTLRFYDFAILRFYDCTILQFYDITISRLAGCRPGGRQAIVSAAEDSEASKRILRFDDSVIEPQLDLRDIDRAMLQV